MEDNEVDDPHLSRCRAVRFVRGSPQIDSI